MKNLKLFLKSSMVVLLTLFVMTIAGCKKDSSETKSSQGADPSVKVENLGTPGAASIDPNSYAALNGVSSKDTINGKTDFFIIYAKSESVGYKSYKTIKRIESKYTTPGLENVPVRVVLLEDSGISLDGIKYDDQTDSYKLTYTYFKVEGKKGDVFEFDVAFSEGIPQAMISVSGDLLYAYYLLQESGVDGLPDGLVVKGRRHDI